MTKGKALLIACGALALLSLVLVAIREVRKASEIKIGLLVNLSGPGGKAGRYIRDGFLFETERCRLRLNPLVGDYDESDETLKKRIDELYEQGVRIFLGPVTSHSTRVAVKYAEETGKDLVIISPYSATTKLSQREDVFIRTCIDNNYFTKALIRWLKRNGIKSLFAIADTINPEFTLDILDRVLKTAPRNQIEVAWITINSKRELKLKEIVEKASPYQAILLLTRTRESAIIAQKLRSAGYTGRFVATVWSQIPELIEWGGKAVEGLTIISFVKPKYSSSKFKTYDKIFRQKAGYPLNARAVRAIEATEILCSTLEELNKRGENPTPANVLKHLTNRGYRTIMDSVFIDRYGDAFRPVYEISIEGGAFKLTGAILYEH